MQKLSFIFPGQGSQKVGMGKSLVENYPVAKKTFEEADDILGMRLSQLCFDGPEDELRQTENTQLAVLTHSIAAFRVLQDEGVSPNFVSHDGIHPFKTETVVAGHSLGEYSALVASEALRFFDALNLVFLRAQFMADASNKQPSGMVAVIGLDENKLAEICKEASSAGIVQIANYNCPGQIVISGEFPALEKAISLAQKAKAKKCIPLPVSGAFHSALMKPAEDSLRQVIQDVPIAKPEIKFIANVTGDYVYEPERIRELLVSQVTNSVQWELSIRNMIGDGITKFVEIGPGRVLSGMVRRINRKVDVFNVAEATDVSRIVALFLVTL